ncbi:MAG: hypothetical protein U1A78_24105 [Polyangia bacterium]
MKKVLVGLLCCLLHAALAAAQPVTGSGAEAAWLAPQAGLILDVAAGKAQPISMGGARRIPDTGWLAAQLRAGEAIWVHLDGDPQGKAVRFAFLSGGADAAAAVEVKPEQRAPGDFVLTAPVGPPTWLGLGVRPGHSAPRAQIWVGTVKSPAYRWELWEELAKKWAAERKGPPPSPPDVVGEPLVEQLALIQDAVALAQAESRPADTRAPGGSAIESLLRAEALLAAMPAREPVFPYYRRFELTGDLGKSRPQQKVEGLRMAEVREAAPARFTVEGPCILRIEARARFEEAAPFRAAPLMLQLRAGSRLLQVASEEVTPRPPEDAGPPSESGLFSSQRRMLLVAPPGRHSYELRVRGVPAWVSVITHRPVVHLDDAASHAEDVPRLLARARAAGSDDVVAQLLAAEASFLMLDDDKARAGFQRLYESARSPRLRAFAQLRLAALAPKSDAARAAAQSGLDELAKSARPAGLGDGSDEATRRVRGLLVAEQLTRVVAELAPGTAPPADVVDLLLRTPEALPYMLGAVGPLLRYVPGYRSQALPLLAQAQKRSPLDVTLRHALAREWFTGTRFTALPTVEMAGARRVQLLSPPHESITCAEATAEGIPAYVPLSETAESVLQVPDELAPPQTLHRFQLVSLRSGPPRLGLAELVLDGGRTSLPLVLPSEHFPIALAAGRHTLRVSLRSDQPQAGSQKGDDKASSLLGPCALLAQSTSRALLVEQRTRLTPSAALQSA